MPVLTLHPDYGYVLLVTTGMAFHVFSQMIPVGLLRQKYKLEYPDMGSGRYAAKLTDKQWIEFNNAQRVHQNYVEGFAPSALLLLMGGLFYPKESAAVGVVYIVGRQVYGMGYRAKGPSGRTFGAKMHEVASLGLLGITVYGTVKHLGYL